MERSEDWINEAQRDLLHALNDLEVHEIGS